jgi:GT2 family glycosyltransferase
METVETYLKQGDAFRQEGKWEEAIKCYEKVIELEPDHWSAYHYLGDYFFSKEKFDHSISYYRNAIKYKPDFNWSYCNLGRALYIKGRTEEAIDFLLKAVKVDPKFTFAYLHLAKILLNTGNLSRAIEIYHKVLELEPENLDAIQGLSSALNKQSRSDLEARIQGHQNVSIDASRFQSINYEDPAIASQADLVCFDWDMVIPELKDLSSELYSVDIIVCVHNALEDVKNCLTSIINHTHVKYHVIVVDDGSETETEEFLKTWVAQTPRTTLLRNPTARGYTKAANQGLKASGGDYTILLNSDTIATPRWIEKMVECAKSDEKIGVVGPLSNCASWQSVPELFSPKGDWMINQIPEGYSLDKFSQLVEKLSTKGFPQVNFVNGFCYMMTRAVIDAVGLLDEASFPHGYGEENDFSLRVSQAGFKLAIADHAYVYHAKSKSFGHQRRKELAKQGSKTLKQKHPQADLKALTEKIKNSQPLEQLRFQLQEKLNGN